jgi:hypothetical protein
MRVMTEIAHSKFADCCLISCGMLHPEINHLVEIGFLNPRRILFTPPGLHALPGKLEEHLLRRLTQAREYCPKHRIVVVYGNSLLKISARFDNRTHCTNGLAQGKNMSAQVGALG